MPDSDVSRREILKYTGGAVGAAALSTGSAAGDGRIEVNVGYSKESGRRAARNAAANVKREFNFRALTIRIGRAAADRLDRRDDVRYVEENDTMEALAQTTPYGIEQVEADVAHADGETGDGAHVSIIDTGIDATHEDLEGNLGTGRAFGDAACQTDCGGPFCSANGIDTCYEEWDDDNDHGTHCAGTVGAIDNDTGVVGVAPDVTLHAAKVLDCCGSGSYDDIAAGIEWTADQGYDVGSMSLGGDDSSVVKDACVYAYDKGVLLVAAAGNDGPCSDCVGYPAAYEECIAVSATDENDDLADFSSTGPEVELAAPGVDVLSSIPRSDYDRFDGTSMACPHVAGAGAQLMANSDSNETARQKLRDGADDVGLDDNEQGYGRLNVADSLGLSEGLSVSTDSATDVTDSSATLNGTLDDLDGADSADVSFEWGPAGDLSNTTESQTLSSTGSFSEEITGLDGGTEYEFRAVAQASDGDTDTGATTSFTTDGDCVDASTWPDGTGRDGDENVDELDLGGGQVVGTSDANAYEDFTCPDVVAVEQGGSFDVAMEWSDGGYDGHYANVFVDWDQNGDWSTADETVLMENVDDDSVTATATVDVPSDAPTGETLVRVRLSWDGFDDAGDTDEYGEVDDFTVSVKESTDDSDCVDASTWPDGTGRDGDENVDELDLASQVVETSADNAYEDFTCPDVVSVQQGGSFDVAMDWSDGGYDDHYANVFVDWDQNEDWSTAQETVLMESVDDDSVTATATVDVPSDAATGSTLVRVRLSWSGLDDAGDTDEYGEVNDFTVTVE